MIFIPERTFRISISGLFFLCFPFQFRYILHNIPDIQLTEEPVDITSGSFFIYLILFLHSHNDFFQISRCIHLFPFAVLPLYTQFASIPLYTHSPQILPLLLSAFPISSSYTIYLHSICLPELSSDKASTSSMISKPSVILIKHLITTSASARYKKAIQFLFTILVYALSFENSSKTLFLNDFFTFSSISSMQFIPIDKLYQQIRQYAHRITHCIILYFFIRSTLWFPISILAIASFPLIFFDSFRYFLTLDAHATGSRNGYFFRYV